MDRICEGCEEKFSANRPYQKFCDSRCRQTTRRKDKPSYTPKPPDKIPISKSSKGAAQEMIVCADLLFRGYGVFRSVSPSCRCDLIAMKGDNLIRIEVKTHHPHLSIEASARNMGKKSIYDILATVFEMSVTYIDKNGNIVDM